ncbi:MAG: anthranilate synthase component I family protein [Thermodesulfovibrionales bacterium]
MFYYRTESIKREVIEYKERGFYYPLYREIPYNLPRVVYPLFSGSNSFVFESIKGPEKIARFSFIGFEPSLRIKIKNGFIEISSQERVSVSQCNPLKRLKEILFGYKQRPVEFLPPFQGGLAGLLSYDFVHYLERLPRTTIDDLHIPDADLFLIDRLIAFDHLNKRAWAIVCPGLRDSNPDPSCFYDEAEYHLDRICRIAGTVRNQQEVVDFLGCSQEGNNSNIEIIQEMTKKGYMDMVRQAKEYIAAGDIFQANLSQRVSAHIPNVDPWDIYNVLSSINPSPFAGYINFGDYHIVSSSPERLVRIKDSVIETRPIAGTRPRGRNINEDEMMRDELLLNEKERAEHIMLIDLERNDIGKVSDYGTVEVDELMITEDYSHVIHIVSNIRGVLAPNKTTIDAIRAVFPGGTITGVPKVRCMEIIDELEPVQRGPYTGSMGYIGFSGNMDLNIIIRTFVIKNNMAYVQAGAGIVADSDPEREYHETLKKAEALIRTLQMVKGKRK